MVVYLPPPLALCPAGVDPGVEKHLHPGNGLGKDQPHVDHLDVGRLRKTARDADEESREDEKGSEINRDDGLEEEFWKEPVIEQICMFMELKLGPWSQVGQ